MSALQGPSGCTLYRRMSLCVWPVMEGILRIRHAMRTQAWSRLARLRRQSVSNRPLWDSHRQKSRIPPVGLSFWLSVHPSLLHPTDSIIAASMAANMVIAVRIFPILRSHRLVCAFSTGFGCLLRDIPMGLWLPVLPFREARGRI